MATNTVLRVKGSRSSTCRGYRYPIGKDEDRATGFLPPTYGTSTLRGQAISNAFFWAINRSQDATFFHDWFTNTGLGFGSENGMSPQRSRMATSAVPNRSARSRVHRRRTDDDVAGDQELRVRGTMYHTLSRNVRARARLDTSRTSRPSNSITRMYKRHAEQSNHRGGPDRRIRSDVDEHPVPETNTSPTRRTPLSMADLRVSTSVAPQRLFASPIYASVNSEYAYLPNRSVNDGEVTNDDSHARVDLAPTLRAPLSRLTFLSVNTSANYRATYYSRSAGPTGGTGRPVYFRQYMALHTDIVGPVFTRIWDRPESVFADRLKHVIEPAFTVDLTSRIEDLPEHPSWVTRRNSWSAARRSSPTG